jgi:hypothetical protein
MMRRINQRVIYALTAVLVVLSACKQDPPPKFHFEYFGLEEGRFVIYDVVEVDHDDAIGIHDTTTYQLKTVWGGD